MIQRHHLKFSQKLNAFLYLGVTNQNYRLILNHLYIDFSFNYNSYAMYRLKFKILYMIIYSIIYDLISKTSYSLIKIPFLCSIEYIVYFKHILTS